MAGKVRSARGLLAAARLRGRQIGTELLTAEGGALTTEEAGARFSLSPQEIEGRRQNGRLLALPGEEAGCLYPAWQFMKGRTLPGLEEVLAELRGHDPWMQLWFFLSPDHRLGGETPLQVLRRGEVEPVRRAASLYGEHGAV